jgi:Ser/Thr protein kinase RdoA (MazF antagonist)
VEEKYNSRINYHGKLEDISKTICNELDIGDFVANKLILTGYEDYNFILETTKNKYFVKIFAKFRTMEDCERYLNVMANVTRYKVKTPKLIKSKSRYMNKIGRASCRERVS